MGELFNRDFQLTVGQIPLPVQLADPLQSDTPATILKVSFSVERNSNKDPNRAEVTIYNLNSVNRETLKQGAELLERFSENKVPYDWPLVIEAGYVGSREVLFSGNITFASSRKETVDFVTDIECGDGERQFRSNRINQSFGPGTPVAAVISAAAAKLGVGPGNLSQKIAPGVFRKGYSVFKTGVTVSGKASKVIDKYLSSAGFTWSIQDGQLQILAPEETTFEQVVVLTPQTGLIGTPEKGEKGRISVTSLLQGAIKPGRRIALQSENVSGFFKVETVKHYGDTWSNEWYTEAEMLPL